MKLEENIFKVIIINVKIFPETYQLLRKKSEICKIIEIIQPQDNFQSNDEFDYFSPIFEDFDKIHWKNYLSNYFNEISFKSDENYFKKRKSIYKKSIVVIKKFENDLEFLLNLKDFPEIYFLNYIEKKDIFDFFLKKFKLHLLPCLKIILIPQKILNENPEFLEIIALFEKQFNFKIIKIECYYEKNENIINHNIENIDYSLRLNNNKDFVSKLKFISDKL